MGKVSISLKQKMVLLVLVITLILGGMTFGILNYISLKVQDQQFQSFESHAISLSDAIGAQFYERYGDVQTFSISPSIQSSNRQTIVDTLNTFSALYSIYDLILVVGKNGKLLAVNSKGPDGKEIKVAPLYEKSYADEPWFKAALNGEFTTDKEKGFSGTFFEEVHQDPFASEVYGEKRLGNSFSTAIKDTSGNVIGVISNRAGARWFEGAIKELFRGLKKLGINTADVSLLGKDGTLLFEYTSNPDSADLDESKYDWNHILKLNLLSAKDAAAMAVLSKASGAGEFKSASDQAEYVTGFSRVSGPKFIESIGWSVLVRQPADSKEGLSELFHIRNAFYVTLIAVIFVSLLAALRFSGTLSNRLSKLADQLSTGASSVAATSKEISISSSKLSEAATEQASAIQETAASLDEVTAMLRSASDNAAKSQDVSRRSREFAEKGKASIQEMIDAISNINQSNESIMKQVDQGNVQISEIIRMIEEIGQKTKVINDIVFQTKLLSFNASVEAARAGEQGKGFAVVAEEVGNLARMSGNAATEISSLLESSTQRVERIISDTKTNVDQSVKEGRDKVRSGTEIAKRCYELLEQILNSAKDVDTMVTHIARSSVEQTQGVGEINKAMNQLDSATQQNTSIAHQEASTSVQLEKGALDLESMVQELNTMVKGGTKSARSRTRGTAVPKERPQTAPVTVASRSTNETPEAEDPRFTEL